MKTKMYSFTIFFLLFIQASYSQNWVQQDVTLFGAASGDSYGRSVSLNNDGTIAAISAGGNFSPARVSVLQFLNNHWTPLGADIPCEANDVHKLSKDGSTLIIGNAGDHDPSGNWCGSISVYKWNGTAWTQKGGILYGPLSSGAGYFGSGVGISQDGNAIMVLSHYDLGRVRVYRWNASSFSWQQQGSTVSLGNATSSVTASSADFSADGSAFVVGKPYVTNGIAGVFSWNGNDWVAKGSIFTGVLEEHLGGNVSINDDGSVIVIGSPLNDTNGNNTGELRVYQWNGSAWIQKGQTFNGSVVTANNCCLANITSRLNSSGDVFAYWSVTNDNPQQGTLKSFYWSGSQWIQYGGDIEGGLGDNSNGHYISLNSDGRSLAIGFPFDFYFNDGISTGRTKIYRYSGALSNHQAGSLTATTIFPNPCTDKIYFSQSVGEVSIFDMNGRLMTQTTINGTEMDVSFLSSGFYVSVIETENGTVSNKLIKN